MEWVLHVPPGLTMTTASPSDNFASTYAESVANFRAATPANATVHTFTNPLTDPDGGALTTDVIHVGSLNAPKLLVMLSGTHGVEAFCGSGIQIDWLQRDGHVDLPDDCAALIIHCVNPYGAAWSRRVNEDNVDLNRNFVDHDRPHFENEHYAEFHDVVVPTSLTGPGRRESDELLEQYRLDKGDLVFETATLGQYSHPDGMNYGGTVPTWSTRIINELIDEYCVHRRHVATLDLHSGLGPFGSGLVGIANDNDSNGTRLARQWYGDGMTTFDDMAEQTGYLDYTHFIDGLLMRAFVKQLPDVNVVAGGIEFGTFPWRDVLEAERSDLWLYANPDADPHDAEAVRAELLRVYYPGTPDWLDMVETRARQVINQTVAGLGAL